MYTTVPPILCAPMNDTGMYMVIVGTRVPGEESAVGSYPILEGKLLLFVNTAKLYVAMQRTKRAKCATTRPSAVAL